METVDKSKGKHREGRGGKRHFPSLHEEIQISLIRDELQTNRHNEMSVMSIRLHASM